MKYNLLLLFLFISHFLFAQKPDPDDLMQEGKKLYYSEKASWYASDHFIANFGNKRDSLGGYLSYSGPNGQVYSIFYSRNNPNHILARYTFPANPSAIPLTIDTLTHTPINIEKDLISIRQQAMQLLNDNPDKFFSFYKNTSINAIPVITGKERKVYLLTAPQQFGSVLLGNDYLLEFNPKNELKKKSKLHNSLIELNAKGENGQNLKASIHSHVLSNHIEPTDICTLLLYKEYVEWTQHYVVHQDYISILDLEKEQLVIMPKKAFDKMLNDKK